MFYAFPLLANLRRQLERENTPIEQTDWGAGSQVNPTVRRSIRSLARHSAVPPRVAQGLFRLTNHLKARHVLELGTSLGLSTLHFAAAIAPQGQVYTIEGCPATAARAQSHFQELGFNNITSRVGPFAEVLPAWLPQLPPLDLVFIDGDHRLEPTLAYWEQLWPHLAAQGVVVVADIHWSAEMEAAWATLQQHPAVSCSIDFFHWGLLCQRSSHYPPQHFTLVPATWKPWHWGLFPPRRQGSFASLPTRLPQV